MKGTNVANHYSKRLRRLSSFEIEPVFMMTYTPRGRRLMRARHMPMWAALRRMRHGYTLTYHTHAVLPERLWMRAFRNVYGRE